MQPTSSSSDIDRLSSAISNFAKCDLSFVKSVTGRCNQSADSSFSRNVALLNTLVHDLINLLHYEDLEGYYFYLTFKMTRGRKILNILFSPMFPVMIHHLFLFSL